MLVFNRKGKLATDPTITTYGLPRGETGDLDEELAADMEEALTGAIQSLGRHQAMDDEAVEEAARRAVRAATRERWGKKPVISVEIIRLES